MDMRTVRDFMALLCSAFAFHWHPVVNCIHFKTLRLGNETRKCSPSQLPSNCQVLHVARQYLTMTHLSVFFTLVLMRANIRMHSLACLFFLQQSTPVSHSE